MASSACSATLASTFLSSSAIFSVPKPEFSNTHIVICSKKRPFVALRSGKWSSRASFFSGFVAKVKDIESLKQELLAAIQPLDRGAEATTEDQQRIDEIAREMEEQNKIKKPLNSNLLNGKWELLYTTSQSVLKTQRPKFLRPNGKIYQAINVYTLRAQNMETWPFFNQATANLVPLNSRRVAVKFDFFKICDTDKKSGKWSRAAGNHLLGRRTADFERRSRQLVYSEDGGSVVQSSSLTRRRGVLPNSAKDS